MSGTTWTQPCMYAWIIDFDHVHKAGVDGNEMETVGPNRAETWQANRLLRDIGVGERFRLVDSDGFVMFTGRIDFGAEHRRKWNWFAPLDQFGRSYGCTSIEYFENGKWVEQ